MNIAQLKESALANSDTAKARTFDQMIGHLVGVIETDPRPRERARASLAKRTILQWIKEAEAQNE